MRGPVRVIVVADAAPARGGIATFAETVTDHLELPQWVDVALLNTTRRATWRGGAPSLANVWRALVDFFRVLLAARRAHVVHLQTALLPTLPLLRAVALCVAARIGGAGVICHAHTGLVNRARYETFHPGAVTRALLRCLTVCDAIVTVSRAGAAGLRPFVGGSSIVYVPNAVDAGRYQPREPDTDDGGRPTVLYVGALGTAKGVVDLLEAARRSASRGAHPWRMRVLGGANQQGLREAERVRRRFAQAGFADALLGSVPPGEVVRHIHDAQIVVLPSWSEGMPLAVLEAMACARPVVVTEVGALPDVVRDGCDGLIVPPRDPDALAAAVERLACDPGLRRQMGTSARRRVEGSFDLPRLADDLAELYRRTASRGL